MADEEKSVEEEDAVEISEALEQLVLYAVDEARAKLDEVREIIPFTVLLQGENLYFETHPGDDPDECRDSARNTVRQAESSIESYAFCYDGYVETDDGSEDAIIVEACEVDDDEPYVFCLRYTIPEDEEAPYEFNEGLEVLEKGMAESLL